MLAEKFFLLLETVLSHIESDGAPRIKSNSNHVPIKLSPARRPDNDGKDDPSDDEC